MNSCSDILLILLLILTAAMVVLVVVYIFGNIRGESRGAKSMEEAVDWVLNDAAYKAPEQIGIVAERWIEKLREAKGS